MSVVAVDTVELWWILTVAITTAPCSTLSLLRNNEEVVSVSEERDPETLRPFTVHSTPLGLREYSWNSICSVTFSPFWTMLYEGSWRTSSNWRGEGKKCVVKGWKDEVMQVLKLISRLCVRIVHRKHSHHNNYYCMMYQSPVLYKPWPRGVHVLCMWGSLFVVLPVFTIATSYITS